MPRLGPATRSPRTASSRRRAEDIFLCGEVVKPEWWNDEGLKALSARVVRAAPNEDATNLMRAHVLHGQCRGVWEARPRSSAELMEAATHYERAAAMMSAPALKAEFAGLADYCHRQAAWAGAM